MIKIISDGTALGTEVLNADGKKIHGVVSIVFGEIRSGIPLTATLTVFVGHLDCIVPSGEICQLA